jgi:hypothetical protein
MSSERAQVIQEDTVSHQLDSACFDPKLASRFKDALADYSRVRKRRWLLQPQFRIEKPYELVSSDTILGRKVSLDERREKIFSGHFRLS